MTGRQAAGGSRAADPAKDAGRPDEAVRREMLSDGVYAKLKEQLMEHVVEPGARLSIDGLARRFHVSQTPVREALARLESDGLVVKRPLAGYSATPPLDLAGFDNLFEMRLLLEPAAAGSAALRATPAELAAIAKVFETMSVAEEGSDVKRYQDFSSQDGAFHKAIAAASGNDLLADAIDRLQSHKHFYKLYYYTPGITEKTLTEHHDVLVALQERDPEVASRAMANHIAQSRRRLRPASMAISEQVDGQMKERGV
jgi:DNA-binding GntR family transcriptional regulator